MSLPRTFVGFSSTDLHYFRLMQAWKANKNIDFNFTNCQLQAEINSNDESYIKRKCRERINMAGTFAILIGADTRSKHKYVRWEIEVAIEKQCRIIGINLNGSRKFQKELCPPVANDIGALFVPFSPGIVAHALNNFTKKDSGNWHYPSSVYDNLAA